MGYLQWAPNVTGEKMEITFPPYLESNKVRWTQSPTLYHFTIKARQYKCVIYLYLVTFIYKDDHL